MGVPRVSWSATQSRRLELDKFKRELGSESVIIGVDKKNRNRKGGRTKTKSNYEKDVN